MREEFRDVVGFEGKYTVSNMGRVYSVRNRLYLKPQQGGTVTLRKRGRRQFGIGRMVLAAFIGPCPEGMECCHYDDDVYNNCLSNLRWDTHRANTIDRERNQCQVHYRGEFHGRAILSEEQVVKIKSLKAQGYSYRSLAGMYGVGKTTIVHIIKGNNWRHVS